MSGQSRAQLSSKKRIVARDELRLPILEEYQDVEHKHRRRKDRCCENGNTQTTLLFGIFFMMAILAVVMVVVVVSVYGPAGKVQNTILTVSDMVARVNNSGLTDIVVAVATTWQKGNHTEQTFTLLDALYHSGTNVADIVLAIEPEIIQQLANRTTITITGLLALAETIINNQGIDIVRVLLACLMLLTRVLVRQSRCTGSECRLYIAS
jgi:methylmalonyl-CoA mutase cobalamin-binding subunit